MNDWKYLKRLKTSKNHGIMIGVAIATGALALAGIICLIVKCCKHGYFMDSCCCDDFDDDDDFDEDDDEDEDYDEVSKTDANTDENGCRYTNDKDFVE